MKILLKIVYHSILGIEEMRTWLSLLSMCCKILIILKYLNSETLKNNYSMMLCIRTKSEFYLKTWCVFLVFLV